MKDADLDQNERLSDESGPDTTVRLIGIQAQPKLASQL